MEPFERPLDGRLGDGDYVAVGRVDRRDELSLASRTLDLDPVGETYSSMSSVGRSVRSDSSSRTMRTAESTGYRTLSRWP